MDGGYISFPAYGFNQIESLRIQLENGTAVDNFQITEFSCDLTEHFAVEKVIGIFIHTFIQMIVAEGTFSVHASPAAEQNNFSFLFFQNFTVSFHVKKASQRTRQGILSLHPP